MSFEGFCQPVCFFAARFTLRQPKTPVRNATNLFWRLSICISRDSLSCDTRSVNLCILFKFLFSYLWYIPPHSCAFDTFYFTPIFFNVYITKQNIFLNTDDAVARDFCCSEFPYYFWFQQSKASFEIFLTFFLTFIVFIQWTFRQDFRITPYINYAFIHC